MLIQVIDAWFNEKRSQASGGICRALWACEWKKIELVGVLNWKDVCVSNSPANKISNDIRMAHHQCIRVLLLLGIGTMEILPEAGFNASTVLEKLLHFNGVIHKIRMIHTKMGDEWKSERMKIRCILCFYDDWQQRKGQIYNVDENQRLRVVRDASGRLVAAVQSVHPLRSASNFQLVDLPRASKWFYPFPVPESLSIEPFCRVEFSIPSNARRWIRLACDPFRWDTGPHRWHHSNCTVHVWWESGDELQTAWPFPISRWTYFRPSVLHSISMVSPDFVAPDWKWTGKSAGEIIQEAMGMATLTYWSQLKFHLAAGDTIVFVVHELLTCVSWARFK